MSAGVVNDHIIALHRAIRYFGTQRDLARHLKINPVMINHWLNRNQKIPLHYAEWISMLTNGEISRYELAPYARFLESVRSVKSKKTIIA